MNQREWPYAVSGGIALAPSRRLVVSAPGGRWPEAKRLTAKEKRLITSNVWAFVFVPFYHPYLGMWRKAITLSLVALVIDVFLAMAGDALNVPANKFLWIVSAVIFQQCANVDYYRKAVLKRREWW